MERSANLTPWSQPRLRVLAESASRRLPGFLSLLLLLYLAALLASLVWALVPADPDAGLLTSSPRQAPAPATDPIDLKLIRKASLFGVARAATKPSVSALASAPETRLNLKLLGILANRAVPQDSRAVIDGGHGGEKPYAIGDDILPGVTLKAIFPDRVVLKRNGRLEALKLDRKGAGIGSRQAAATPIAVDHGQTGNDSIRLEQIRQQLLTNPGAASRYLRVQPVAATDGRGQIGYRVYPGPDRTAFQATGLHPGDLVTAVNGQALTDPGQTLQLLSQLTQASSVTLTVQRGDQTRTVNLRFSR